jgi:sterol desaturase/sphingolipid hydroxylase (fatty acid hydroxylase superfamily)
VRGQIIGSVVNTLVLPIGIYAFAQHQAPGLLSRLNLPFAAELLLTFLLLDLWRYWEHRLFHRVPLLWRLHLVHHSDTQVDVTTSERHHPLEFVAGTAVMMALIGAFGLPAPAVGLYLLVATVVTLYSHANLRLRPSLDRPLGRLLVTPAVHAVHHSDLRAQTDSNYGSVLMIWDRWFGTYVDPQNARIPQLVWGIFGSPVTWV